MRILVWHVHGGWMDAFVRGDHEYLIPTTPARDAWGLGRGGRDWPETAVEIDPADIADAEVDVVVLQRAEEEAEARRLLGGRAVPMVVVEHNTPRVDVPDSRHPFRDRDDLTIAHVTHWNALMWDCGSTRTTVVEHGVVDPGPRYTGTLDRLGVVINEPVRRNRVVGTDLLPRFAAVSPVDVWGMGTERLATLGHGDRIVARGDVPTGPMHAALAERRAYVHPNRWTSLGLSLIEAMHLAMPVLVLATTDAARTVPAEAGAIATDVDELVRASRTLSEDPDEAARRGRVAREAALARHSLARFTADWDQLLDDVVTRAARRGRTALTGAGRTALAGTDRTASTRPARTPAFDGRTQ